MTKSERGKAQEGRTPNFAGFQKTIRSWLTENQPGVPSTDLAFSNLFFLYTNTSKFTQLQALIGQFLQRFLELVWVDRVLTMSSALFASNISLLKESFRALDEWIQDVTTSFKITACPKNGAFEHFVQAINDLTDVAENLWVQAFLFILKNTDSEVEKGQYKAITARLRAFQGFCT